MSKVERDQLLGILFGQRSEVCFENLKPLNRAARTSHLIRSQVVGGNLAVLQSGNKTRGELNPHKRILFLEDTGERPHRVDRMLAQITQAGWLAGAKAVIFGHFLRPGARPKAAVA